MKLIDLLNLMVIGEDLPKRIRYEDEEYYLTDDEETYIGCISHSAIGRRHCLEQCLTDEIEIIEEDKKIEKLEGIYIDFDCIDDFKMKTILKKQGKEILKCKEKINELIDEVNKLKGDKNER